MVAADAPRPPTGPHGLGPGVAHAALRDAAEPALGRLQARQGARAHDDVVQWIEQLDDIDPTSALALARVLDRVLERLDPGAFARWLLTGLRRYPEDPSRREAYFRLEDRHAIEALHGEAGARDLARDAPSLAHLLSALAGREVLIQPRPQSQLNAAPLRPVITPTHLLLPDHYTTLDSADRARLHRAAVAHAVAHLRYSTPAQPAGALKPMAIAVISAIEDARVEQLLIAQLPGVAGWFGDSLRASARGEGLGFESLLSRLCRALHEPDFVDGNYWVDKGQRLVFEHARARGWHDAAGLRAIGSILANDLGQMRVRYPGDEVAVPAAYRDDHSYLWDRPPTHEPPPPQDLWQPLARPSPPRDAHDPEPPRLQAPVELARHAYPEWDRRAQHLRPAWATVIDWLVPPLGRADDADAGPGAVRLPLAHSQRLQRSRKLRRQWEGDDIDLNAAIECQIDRRLRRLPDSRLFMRPGRAPQATDIVVLLDLSQSANDRVGGSMASILDLEKRATLMLVRAVWRGPDTIAVHGFRSNTREAVDYLRLLDFDAPRDPAWLGGIVRAQASLSTRLGAALRHATTLLAARGHARRAIIVVTDGAPADIDVPDPQDLVDDAAAAVGDAARRGVECHCVAVDPRADGYVRRIFGWRRYQVVDRPSTLATRLAQLYSRMASR